MTDSSRLFFDEHRCAAMPASGVVIYHYRHTRIRETATWQLWIIREATEQDLEENSILTQVGEIIWQTIIEISHCPYCGESLMGKDDSLPVDNGRFIHIDHSAWHTRYG